MEANKSLQRTLGIALTAFTIIRKWFTRKRSEPLDVFVHEYEYRHRLKELWEEPKSPQAPPEAPTRAGTLDSDIRFSRKRPDPLEWKIAFTTGFTKAVMGADRSMQGRVLLALAEISSNPTTPHGDTVKPLSKEKQGLWRYRLGDYRLVYEPLSADRMVLLIDFAARGDVYE